MNRDITNSISLVCSAIEANQDARPYLTELVEAILAEVKKDHGSSDQDFLTAKK